MSALDQAFIKAFEKNQSGRPHRVRRHSSPTLADGQAPLSSDLRQSLVLHDLFNQGDQLRFDLKPHSSTDPDPVGPPLHLASLTSGRTEAGSGDVDGPSVAVVPSDQSAEAQALAETVDAVHAAVKRSESGGLQREPVIRDRILDPSLLERFTVAGIAADSVAPFVGSQEIAWQPLDRADITAGSLFLEPVETPSGELCDTDGTELAEYLQGVSEQIPRIITIRDAAEQAETASSEQPETAQDPVTDDPVAVDREEIPSAWEVDRFNWPELCGQLIRTDGGELREAGKQLRSATRDGLRVLAVTSTHHCEGRSTLALCLAATVAHAGGRVALLDADISGPDLAARLGIEVPCDWLTVTRQQLPILEAGVASLEDGITLFPLESSAEWKAVDPRFLAAALDQLRRHFELVIVDMPPVPPQEDESRLDTAACPINMAVVVRNPSVTSEQQTIGTANRLRELGIKAIGVAENCV